MKQRTKENLLMLVFTPFCLVEYLYLKILLRQADICAKAIEEKYNKKED